MANRPIIFSAPMILALLDGRKTQTRRLLKDQTVFDGKEAIVKRWPRQQGVSIYKPGDLLWVRENFTTYEKEEPTGDGFFRRVPTPMYAADFIGFDKPDRDWNWTPCIHMPRWASRLTLTVTDVRVQRLQDISEEDAIAEGWQKHPDVSADPDVHRDAASDWFSDLWDSLHGSGAWTENPWIAAITFTVERGNIDALQKQAAA